MDSNRLPRDARDRARTHSRASVDTASSPNTEATPKSPSNHSSYYTPRSTQRAHLASGSANTRMSSRLSRSSSGGESQRITSAPMSSLLQERLERKRRSETNRAHSMSEDLSTTSPTSTSVADMERHAPNSPIRRSATAVALGRRHDDERGPGKSGYTLRAYEKNLDKLHNQNFDLKLKLYHERKRTQMLEEETQSLEQKTEKLESENMEMAMMQEDLVARLRTRDKAVDEAVHIIAMLEAEVEQLHREKDMVRRDKADGSYANTWSTRDERNGTPTPRARTNPAHWSDEARDLKRMPSFLSDQSQHTENLRHVVMRKRSSPFQSRKVSDVSASSADASDVDHRLASPSLSMLSESSFISVYRANGEQDMAPTPSPSPPRPMLPELSGDKKEPSALPRERRNMDRMGSRRDTTASIVPKGSSKRGASLSSQMASLDDVLGKSPPLPHGDSVEKAPAAAEASLLSNSDRASDMSDSSIVRPSLPQPQIKTKEEKREALNKALGTSNPSARPREMRDSHGLPPTPDTVSTSTLRRLHISNDVMPTDRLSTPEDSFVREGTSVADFAPKTPLRQPAGKPSQPASTSAFTSRRINGAQPRVDANLFASQASPSWPHSVGEPVSYVMGSDEGSVDSSSESDDEGGTGAGHLESKFDPWMHESTKLEQNEGHASPDFLSFPEDSHGWKPDALFGAMQGALSTPVAGLERDPREVGVGGIRLVTPEKPLYQPPAPKEKDGGFLPPSRRSSLHARTGSLSKSAVPSDAGRTNSLAQQDSVRGGRGRSSSIDFTAVSTATQAYDSLRGRTNSKRSQYPPITGQAQSSRGRPVLGWGKAGFHGLFRRDRSESGSRGGARPASAIGMPPTAAQGRNSVPPPATMPWTRPPHLAEAPQGRATPPPIMRNRPPSAADSGYYGVDGAATTAYQAYPEEDMKTPMVVEKVDSAPNGQHKNAPQSGGSRRKWLAGMGRRNSLKSKEN